MLKGMIGVDEVGRGCWAGPLVVVAARQRRQLPSGLTDSKLLTRAQRERLIAAIEETCELGEGWVTPAEIDEVGLTAAMQLAVKRALQAITASIKETIIMDGHINYCAPEFVAVETVIKADRSHPIVSAASIYAKVKRDTYMQTQASKFPDYGFEKHVGYGTKLHQQRLAEHGPCELHRVSFKPVRVQHEFHFAR